MRTRENYTYNLIDTSITWAPFLPIKITEFPIQTDF